LAAYGDGAIQVGLNHVEVAVADTPQIARPMGLERNWVRRLLIGVIAAEVLAVVALFTFSPALQSWTHVQVQRLLALVRPVPAAPALGVGSTPERLAHGVSSQ
jgi:hypothetical protein